jgi:hypothetical protein
MTYSVPCCHTATLPHCHTVTPPLRHTPRTTYHTPRTTYPTQHTTLRHCHTASLYHCLTAHRFFPPSTPLQVPRTKETYPGSYYRIKVCMYHNYRHNYTQLYTIYRLTTHTPIYYILYTIYYILYTISNMKVPSISLTEWHPFSLASSVSSHHLTFFVASTGDWTRALHSLVLDKEKRDRTMIMVRTHHTPHTTHHTPHTIHHTPHTIHHTPHTTLHTPHTTHHTPHSTHHTPHTTQHTPHNT